jgi:hypothetical protein
MREIRQSGSEGGAAGVATGRPYPYRHLVPSHDRARTADDNIQELVIRDGCGRDGSNSTIE